MTKLSQFTPAISPPQPTDQIVGVVGGVTDVLFSSQQVQAGAHIINSQSQNYVLQLSDAGQIVEMNAAVANTLTVPLGLFPIGTYIEITQAGIGTTTVFGASGVTIQALGGDVTMVGQFGAAWLYQRALNIWLLCIVGAGSGNNPIAAGSILGNNTLLPEAPGALAGFQVTAMLSLFTSSLQGLVPPSGGGTTNFLRADGTWVAPAGGGGGSPGGTSGQIQYDNAGSFGGFTMSGDGTLNTSSGVLTISNSAITLAKMANETANTLLGNNTGSAAAPAALTATQVTAFLNLFTSGLQGLVPASGGGTTNFLRADGTFAAPPSGGTPASPSGSIQYNNAGSFGAFGYWDGSATLRQANSTTPQSHQIYNTIDTISGPTNFERLVADFTTTANVATIGTQAGGTGTLRALKLLFNFGANTSTISEDGNNIYIGDSSVGLAVYKGGSVISLGSGTGLNWTASGASASRDTGIGRTAPAVINFNSGFAAHDGWMQWGGQARVTSDFSVTSSTALTNVTGLSVNVAAGRTYYFRASLNCTDAAAGGVKAAIAGTATATNIIYNGYIVDGAAIVGNAQATALGGAVASGVTTGTTPMVVIEGIITVNAAGTLTVQIAQNTSSATATVAKRGSSFIVHDMP